MSTSRNQLLRPDHDVVEVKPIYFIPSENWANETKAWFEERVRRQGCPHADQLIDTYGLTVDGVLGPIMADYRSLLERLARQDDARQRLIKKLVKAGVPLTERKEDLTAAELMALLDDFQADEEARLAQDNTVGTMFAVGAGVLKTLVAWPFFSNILEGTHFTGMLPTLGGFIGAAFAGAVTTGAIWWWYRSLLNLFPAKPVSATLANGKTVTGGVDAGFVVGLRRSLHRSQQTHPVVSGTTLLLLTAAIAYLWRRWQEVDFFTITTKLHITSDVAGAMASSLVSMLMLAALVGAFKKEGVAQGRRRIDEVTVILRNWMSDEISALYDAEVDRDTYNAICTRKDWAAQRILCIGMLVVWKDLTLPDVVNSVSGEILALREEAGRPLQLQFA